jgi:hypothetical protein
VVSISGVGCERDGVGRGWRDQVGVGIRHHLEVPYRVVPGDRIARERATGRVALELIDEHRCADDPLERCLADEALRRGRHHDADGVALLGGQAG